MTIKHLLGLILDDKWSDILFPANNTRWSQDSVLEGLQVPSELLNPLCLTLQKLNLSSYTFKSTCHRVSASVYAFALRQFPKLRKIDLYYDESLVDIFEILEILYKAKETDHQQQQTDFERDIRDAAIQIGIEENMITSPTPFAGFSSLNEFELPISLNDLDAIRAIASVCPQLKKIKLNDHGRNVCPAEERLSVLSKLSKVNNISLRGINSTLLKPVLDVLGTNLTCLKLEYVIGSIDMSFLAPCSKLEQLSITRSSINSEDVDAASRFTPDTFIPMLKSFYSEVCLGVWAPLIERKSKLVDLTLKCSHIGTNAHNPRFEWSKVPEVWPNMESLRIYQCCTGLTMKTVSEIIHQLPKLRWIMLPNSVLDQDQKLTQKFFEEFAEEPVGISYILSEVSCPFLLQ